MQANIKSNNLSNFSNPNEVIGQKVISIDYGLGEVSSIENLQETDGDYFVVVFSDTKTKNYFPVNKNINLRMISSKDEFQDVLEILKEVKQFNEIKTKKDKLEYFNRPITKTCIKSITTRICELSAVKDITNNEKKIIDKLIKTFVLEASLVLETSLKINNQLITDLLKEQNGKR